MTGDFYRTNMGHRFYEGTMPELVAALRRIADGMTNADGNDANRLRTIMLRLADIEQVQLTIEQRLDKLEQRP